ncbi:iron chelate uptake ABC transporter family permease subunit [Nocardia sp. CDC159]|uniref:Iron chelate uptake ABC transporter family permease subunit n=1 Tax=Nocardia pulmonis TaxID=2951408 RepID=A0A9X2IUD2_9NOCA|nr:MULTISPECIES: iron chelate uptake ABC transporter family permease subunit [Nocardia]MCM6771953.1 iron chelate uptake ABC transporter family permease subunit [Nocardia pulmonis]MCM6785389.1 iron chelate uptake ABC transporter family permease subunit [Nocardia sp. CDC159]
MRRSVLRAGPLSLTLRPRVVAVVVVLAALVAVFGCLEVSSGDYPLSPLAVIAALTGWSDDPGTHVVVTEFRLPRALVAITVGAALGFSGAIVQSVARNPLASPDVLGITAGAGAVAVAAATGVTGIGAVTALLGTTGAAMAGGLLTGLVVYLLAWRRGMDGYRLVLVGVSITALMQALTEWFIAKADMHGAVAAQGWLSGSLNGRDWADVRTAAVGLVIAVLATLAVARAVGPMHLGDDVAVGLGVSLVRVRAILLIIAVLLVGVAVAAAGPIPFVAFVAPQLALRFTASATPPLVTSALVGSVLLTGSDWLLRTVWAGEMPVGLATALVGGPFLVYVMVRRNMRTEM